MHTFDFFFVITQKQSPEVFLRKGVLRNFAKFTGKNLVPESFFNKVAGLRLLTTKNYPKLPFRSVFMLHIEIFTCF